MFKNFKKLVLLKDSTYVHYHPATLPLSIGDVLTSFIFKLEKMVAVTKDGHYSIFVPNHNCKNLTLNEFYRANAKLVKFLKRIGGTDSLLNNPINFEKYKNSITEYWLNLAQQTGSKYFSNI